MGDWRCCCGFGGLEGLDRLGDVILESSRVLDLTEVSRKRISGGLKSYTVVGHDSSIKMNPITS